MQISELLPKKYDRKITSKKILEDCQNMLLDKKREAKILEWLE